MIYPPRLAHRLRPPVDAASPAIALPAPEYSAEWRSQTACGRRRLCLLRTSYGRPEASLAGAAPSSSAASRSLPEALCGRRHRLLASPSPARLRSLLSRRQALGRVIMIAKLVVGRHRAARLAAMSGLAVLGGACTALWSVAHHGRFIAGYGPAHASASHAPAGHFGFGASGVSARLGRYRHLAMRRAASGRSN